MCSKFVFVCIHYGYTNFLAGFCMCFNKITKCPRRQLFFFCDYCLETPFTVDDDTKIAYMQLVLRRLDICLDGYLNSPSTNLLGTTECLLVFE